MTEIAIASKWISTVIIGLFMGMTVYIWRDTPKDKRNTAGLYFGAALLISALAIVGMHMR